MNTEHLPPQFFVVVKHPEDGSPRLLGPFVSPTAARAWCTEYKVVPLSVIESLSTFAWLKQAEERMWRKHMKEEGK